MDSDKIEIMINNRYGEFGFSKKAIKEYNLRKSKLNQNLNNELFSNLIARTDKIMIQIYKDFNGDINSFFSQIKICQIDKKYQNCYTIDSLGGIEKIVVDYKQYKLNQITQILESNMNESEKLDEINKIIKSP